MFLSTFLRRQLDTGRDLKRAPVDQEACKTNQDESCDDIEPGVFHGSVVSVALLKERWNLTVCVAIVAPLRDARLGVGIVTVPLIQILAVSFTTWAYPRLSSRVKVTVPGLLECKT